jgi:hypothetical protein
MHGWMDGQVNENIKAMGIYVSPWKYLAPSEIQLVFGSLLFSSLLIPALTLWVSTEVCSGMEGGGPVIWC